MEKRYSISDAARQIEVEAHVLRYWEEELKLPIPRNPQGHRYYRESDIRLLHDIKDLKEQGFQLKAIKIVLPDLKKVRQMMPQELYQLREELNSQVQNEMEYGVTESFGPKVMPLPLNKEQKLEQFEGMMRQMVGDIIKTELMESEERICEQVTTKLIKESEYRMRQKEELQEKQVEILQQILEQVRHDVPEVAVTQEVPVLKSKKSEKKQTAKKSFPFRTKEKKTKAFAKMV